MVEKESHCIWTQADESALIAYITTHQAKGGNGMNFDKSFWVATAAEMANKGTPGVGAPKSPDACHQKWGRLCKFFKVVDKIANSSGISYTREKGMNITAKSETIWVDLLKVCVFQPSLHHHTHNFHRQILK
ncbi:uncharacterized protein BJ212DRAFT_1276369 [Suillus subaureus]|uniref:Myb/SANT-like DNA-binding domain-containing protein n=1 Tax=Suillus subaureus TaxID=48587 RepID=A0A9P7JBC9_9AGAM|nr:uncharacterized protein BJ212DRAFT_1276369 [Suillus subaureus]KAG1812531.1 hypothetical protein BJ212DRAFT_1276369 [Suillus subaureus]